MRELTREEVLAMDVDELNLAVAEKIFQAKVIGKEDDPNSKLLIGFYGNNGWQPLAVGRSWRGVDWSPTEEIAWLDCPRFAEEISAAWEVVEKIQTTYWVRMNSMMKDHFCGVGKPDLHWEYYGNSMPEAICKAALLAVLEATP